MYLGGSHGMKLDWNVIAEIVLGVVIYKLVDSLFNLIFKGLHKMFNRIIIWKRK
jgi:F0F1-type ATP synthase assembly protein I